MMSRLNRDSLNPCFNGRYSLSGTSATEESSRNRLNPCFNGRYSLRFVFPRYVGGAVVLILVLMEDTH